MNPSDNTLDEKIYKTIRDLVYNKAGINLGEGKQALVHARLGKRLRALDLPDHRAYLELLQNDQSGEELVELLDVISTNHTNFFREPAHFEFLTEVVKKIVAQGSRSLRIWCAAASTGEEPYTLSMVCQEAFGPTKMDFRILCTDISTRVLRICKTGSYPKARISDIPPEYVHRYWNKDDGHFVAKDQLKQPLSFARLNLMENPYPMKGPFDIIFCRNVMIYFDRSGREKIVIEALRLLKPGGYLVVGHAESLNGILNGLKAVHPSVYQKSF
jgi:chemotaxis protein methyltransferase CheR